MPCILDWRYFFLPEDSSAAEQSPAASAAARITKILFWTAMAVFIGLLLGRPS